MCITFISICLQPTESKIVQIDYYGFYITIVDRDCRFPPTNNYERIFHKSLIEFLQSLDLPSLQKSLSKRGRKGLSWVSQQKTPC